MAAERMKKVAGLLNCPVCFETYKRPKYLPCHHSYCEGCVEKLQTGSNITCPECRETSAAPTDGAKELPNNFFINRLLDEVDLKRKVEGEDEAKCDTCVKEGKAVALCLDCVHFLCEYCLDFHKNMKEYQNHNITQLVELQSGKKEIDVKPKAKAMLCPDHDLEMNFFCETCDQLVCHYCTTNEHNGHVHNSVKKMAKKHRKEMEKMIEQAEKVINGLSTLRQKVVAADEKIASQTTEIYRQIDEYYDELNRRLQQQREELKSNLRESSAKKKKAISLQSEQIDFTEARLLSVKELNDVVKNGLDQEALFLKKQVGDDVRRLADLYAKLKTEPIELTTMTFKKHEELFSQFGELFGDVVPGNCEVIGIPAQLILGSKLDFTIITKDHNNVHCYKGGSPIFVQAQSSQGGDIENPVQVKDNNDGSYSVYLLIEQAGEIKLSITIEGNHIKGSPYDIMVHRDYKAMKKPKKVVTDCSGPINIAFGKDGVWVVIDHKSHGVYIFDKQDKLIKKFEQNGTGNGQLYHPWGVSFDANNDFYVSEYSNNRVQKFHIDGSYLLQFGHGGSGNGQLSGPSGVTVHSNKVFVADRINHRVSVFQLDGRFSHTFGSGYLGSPHDVAVTTDSQLLVADYNNNCIFKFTFDGIYVNRFGVGHLNKPAVLAIDFHGIILVGECGSNRVSFFDKNEAFICTLGSAGSAEGQFSSPYGIAISSNNDVYIADYNNKRIQIF